MIFDKLKTIIAQQFGVEESSITTEMSFEDDLGADSVDIVELSMALEEEFEVEEMSEEDVSGKVSAGASGRQLINNNAKPRADAGLFRMEAAR